MDNLNVEKNQLEQNFKKNKTIWILNNQKILDLI